MNNTQSGNMRFAQKVISANLSSLNNSLGFVQILSVTAGYSQMKKDSVQAVLIQFYTDLPSLRGSVTNYPNSIGSVQRHPDDIGLVSRLPDYTKCIHMNIPSAGGRDLNRINNIYSVDCLDLRCLRLISPCRAVTINCAELSPSALYSSIASTIGCGTRTSIRFDFAFVDFVAIAGFLCYWCPTIIYKKKYNSRLDVSHTMLLICVPHLEFMKVLNSETPQCWSTSRASNHNVMESYDMAMYKSTQTHPKFKWRFFSCQQSRYFTVEARSEQEARSMLPDTPCLFSARIRQGVSHG